MGMKIVSIAAAVVTVAVGAAGALAGGVVDRTAALAAFDAAHPGVRFFERGGRVERVYGRAFSQGANAEDAAGRFVRAHAGVFGVPSGDLDPRGPLADGRHSQPVMFDAATGTYRFTLMFYTQRHDGLEVFRSDLRLLVRNEPAYPLVLASSTLHELGGFAVDAGALKDPAGGVAAARAQHPALTRFTQPALVIWAGVDDMHVTPRPAYRFVGDGGAAGVVEPAKWLFLTDAVTGGILYEENQLHRVNVVGNVSAMATQGPGADICEPVAVEGMPFARASTGAVTVFGDAAGDFVIPNTGVDDVTVSSAIRGLRFRVTNLGGANSVLSMTVTPPGPADFLHNAINLAEFARGEVNAYIHANVVRDFTLSFNPSYPVIATQTDFAITVNESGGGLCPGNAQYTGDSLRFCASGAGFPNTAWSSVVYHEYGHHLVGVAGSGQGQYGEGMGDTMSVLIIDDPRIGLGFFGNCDEPLRDAETNLQFPCSGLHACAPLLSGSVWDTRNALLVTNPTDYMDILANLAVNAILLHGPGTAITPAIAMDYATLDDDDATLANGTPHYAQINAGFGAHNMGLPAFLEFSYPEGLPFISDPNAGAAIVVAITEGVGTLDPGAPPLLHTSIDDLPFVTTPLTPTGAGALTFTGTLPPAPCFSVIRWYVSAVTTGGAMETSPAGAPSATFAASVVTEITPVLTEDFEAPVGYEVSGSVASPFNGRWEVGVPVGDGTAGDPPEDYDGSGQCYLTGNLPGKDVDGGPTILTTPAFDLSDSGVDYYVGYARWFSNDTGLAPMSDTFVVEISNDDGATWTNLETVGPDGPEVVGGWIPVSHSVSAVIEPTDRVRVRFLASDVGANSTVEAAVDALWIGVGVCDAEDTIPPFVVHDGGTTTAPFSGYVDPRSESDDGVTPNLGLDSVIIRFSEPVTAVGGGGLTPASFVVTGTGSEHPVVTGVDAAKNPVIALSLSGRIPLQEWTTIAAVVEDLSGNAIESAGNQGPGANEPDRVDVAFLPGDIDQSGVVNPLDLLRFKQLVNGLVSPDEGGVADFIDLDRSGTINPLDLLRFKQLINGVSPPSTRAWAGESLNHPRP